MFLQKRNFDRPHPFLKLFSTSFFWPLTFTIPITSLPWCLLLVCESTWKVFSSDERRCACSCRFSLMILSSRLLFWNSKVFEGIGPPTKGGERRLSTFFRGCSIKNDRPLDFLQELLFCFILKILSVRLPLDACNLYTFVWFSLCASACLTLLRMIWPVMRLMFLMSKAANKSVFV